MSGWSIPIDRIVAQTNQRLETVARRAALEVFTAVVVKSPVDTGRFKGNWNVSYAVPNMSIGERLDKTKRGSMDSTTTSIVKKTLSLPVGGVMYLSNGLPYARRLEYGWSGQAPAGMVRLSVREFESHVQRSLA